MMHLSLTVAGGAASNALGRRDHIRFRGYGGTIGRADSNDWVLPDRSQQVSRHHATVHFLGDGYYLQDTSANGIGVNNPDSLIAAGTLQQLQDGQRLYIGPYRIQVRIEDNSARPPDGDHTLVAAAAAAPPARPAPEVSATGTGGASTAIGERTPKDDALGRLLHEAGLPVDRVTTERAEELGRILSTAVQGVVDMLRTRMQFRNELRLPVTTIAGLENNPLKLSTDARDALHNLLVKDNPDYLNATDAFENAFDDLQAHHEAMMEGLREAHNAMMKRFDPSVLESLFQEQQGRRLGRARSVRRKAWGFYQEYFAALDDERDGGFGQLFQEAFARAYEARMALVRSKRGDIPQPDRGKSDDRH